MCDMNLWDRLITWAPSFSSSALAVGIFLTGAGLWTGCDLLTAENEAGRGSMSVLLTDAPFPTDLVDRAEVTIEEIQLVPAESTQSDEESGGTEEDGEGSGSENADSESTGGEAGSPAGKTLGDGGSGEEDEGIITLKTEWTVDGEVKEQISFNLLELQNGVTAELTPEVEIPAGTYSQIRLIVAGEATLVAKNLEDDDRANGETYRLTVPSGTETGVKINLDDLKVADGEAASLTLDFSLEDSFILKGSLNAPQDFSDMIFKPVVHLKSTDQGTASANAASR